MCLYELGIIVTIIALAFLLAVVYAIAIITTSSTIAYFLPSNPSPKTRQTKKELLLKATKDLNHIRAAAVIDIIKAANSQLRR